MNCMTVATRSPLVIMGVSACGKTAVGRAVATRLGGRFVDGDDYHPAENVAKMAAGIPLNDADREPWLDRLHAIIVEHPSAESAGPLVVACSALGRRHRDRLRGGLPLTGIRFIHLAADFTTILRRLEAREGHFMTGRHMLEDQFAALEPLAADERAAGCLTLDASGAVDDLVAQIAAALLPPRSATGEHPGQ